MLAYHVYPKRHLTIVRASGSVATADWANVFGVIQRDPDYHRDGNWLFVAMDAGVNVSAMATEVAAQLRKFEPRVGTRPKCGFVLSGTPRHKAGDPLAVAGVNRWFATRTFMSEQAALAWIGWAALPANG
jgi:hypothetical protein